MYITEKLAKETSREYAFRIIRHNIISLELKPGSMVSENELSAELGISRTPVREALIELSRSQIVEILPQRGSRVSLIDYNMVEEASFLRKTLEIAVAQYACEIVDQLDLSNIKNILKLEQFYLENWNAEKLLETDNDFHKELFILCNKAQTYELMNSMMTHFDRVRSLSLTAVKDTKVLNDHVTILEAIEAKNQDLVKEIITKHLSRYKVDEDVIREKYPEYFK